MTKHRRIIAVANLKGGNGKTSIAIHLAAELQGPRRRLFRPSSGGSAQDLGHLSGGRVAVVDTDPQRSATRWAERGVALPFAVHPLDASRGTARFREAIEQLDVDLLVIDTPPELEASAIPAVLLADLLLVPCSPGTLDLWATRAAVGMAREARLERDNLLPQVSLVPSRVISRTNLAKQLLATLTAIGEPVAPAISQRVAIAQATVEGGTVRSRTPAGREFTTLAQQVLSRLRRS